MTSNKNPIADTYDIQHYVSQISNLSDSLQANASPSDFNVKAVNGDIARISSALKHLAHLLKNPSEPIIEWGEIEKRTLPGQPFDEIVPLYVNRQFKGWIGRRAFNRDDRSRCRWLMSDELKRYLTQELSVDLDTHNSSAGRLQQMKLTVKYIIIYDGKQPGEQYDGAASERRI